MTQFFTISSNLWKTENCQWPETSVVFQVLWPGFSLQNVPVFRNESDIDKFKVAEESKTKELIRSCDISIVL